MKKIYLDYAASTPVHPGVARVMQRALVEDFGNPSSLHTSGRKAHDTIEHARELVSQALGAQPEEIIFTSGGTESNNCAIKGVAFALRDKGNHIITSSIEHHAVLEPCHFLENLGFDITILPVDAYGLVDPDDVKKAMTEKTILVSIMHANNEIGTIEPIEEIGKLCRGRGVYLHTDAVQSFGSLMTPVDELNVDLLSLSAHKFYGPKGVGALYCRKGTRMVPLLHGGGQEGNKRASTQNVAGIAGLGKAVEILMKEKDAWMQHNIHLRDKLTDFILSEIEDTRLNGHPQKRLSNNCHVLVKYVEGESMVLRLDAIGVEAATGSACSSGSLEPSHILLALGISPEDAHGSLRFTVGRLTTDDDISFVGKHLVTIVQQLREISPLWKRK